VWANTNWCHTFIKNVRYFPFHFWIRFFLSRTQLKKHQYLYACIVTNKAADNWVCSIVLVPVMGLCFFVIYVMHTTHVYNLAVTHICIFLSCQSMLCKNPCLSFAYFTSDSNKRNRLQNPLAKIKHAHAIFFINIKNECLSPNTQKYLSK